MAVWNTINLTDIKPDRCDAEYFRKDYQDNIANIKSTGNTFLLGRLFGHNNRGSQPSYSKKGDVKVLRSVNVGFMDFKETRQEYVTDAFFRANTRGQVQKDDILITSTGVGTLGRTSIWYYNEKAYCDGHITILRDSDIDPYFVTAFLNTKYGLRQFDQNYRGSSGQIEIYPYDISKFIIPELLFNYQKEIGDYIREAFRLQDVSKDFYNQASTLLESKLGLDNSDLDNSANKYVSNFNNVVIGKRLDPEFYNPRAKTIVDRIKNLEHTTVGQNFYVKNGFPWKSKKFLGNNSGEPVIRIRDIKPTYIDKDNLTSIEKNYASTISFPKAKAGDVVIGMDGLKYFYASILEEDCMVNQRVCHIERKSPESISAEYTTFIINSKIGQAQLLRDMTIATTVGHITNLNVIKLVIPIVSKNFHDKITSLIRSSIDSQKESKILLKNSIKKIEKLIEEGAKKQNNEQ